MIAYEVSGDGFLRHMVRTIVGHAGRGRARAGRRPNGLRDVVASRDRARRGPTAPAARPVSDARQYDERACGMGR